MNRYSRVARYSFLAALFFSWVIALHPRVGASAPAGDERFSNAAGFPIDVDPALPPAFTNCSDQDSIPVPECQALVALYESTGGEGWSESAGWLKDVNPCHWAFVVCTYNPGSVAAPRYNVTRLNLNWNNLSGPLPAELGNLENLLFLYLNGNQFSGPLPPELGNLDAMLELHLNNNQFSGPLPAELGGLENLAILELSDNQFSGPLPAELGNLEYLESLYLSGNDLSGSLPAAWGNLHNLNWLIVRDNPLSGRLPHELTQLNLNIFDFRATNLCEPIDSEFQVWLGTIPYLFSSGVECVPLGRIYLPLLICCHSFTIRFSSSLSFAGNSTAAVTYRSPRSSP